MLILEPCADCGVMTGRESSPADFDIEDPYVLCGRCHQMERLVNSRKRADDVAIAAFGLEGAKARGLLGTYIPKPPRPTPPRYVRPPDRSLS